MPKAQLSATALTVRTLEFLMVGVYPGHGWVYRKVIHVVCICHLTSHRVGRIDNLHRDVQFLMSREINRDS
jgi:hypothetical protein